MTRDVFPQTTIAVIWDFDKTLTPEYMQKPLFEHFGIDGSVFWDEVNGLGDYYMARGLDLVSNDTLYLNHILTYVREGIFKDLTNGLLLELGAKIEFYPGLPEFFEEVRNLVTEEKYRRFEINVEHYIISTGLRKMILGSKINDFVDEVWANEFVSEIAPPGYITEEEKRLDLALDYASKQEVYQESLSKTILDIGYVLDNTTKTRAIFEINKGSNKEPDIDVNAPIMEQDRRIPFQNMIYIADGPSDVPVFSIVKRFGGKAYAVFKPENKQELKQVAELQEFGRIHAFGEADYRSKSQTNMWITMQIEKIANRIVETKENDLKMKTGDPPGHISE